MQKGHHFPLCISCRVSRWMLICSKDPISCLNFVKKTKRRVTTTWQLACHHKGKIPFGILLFTCWRNVWKGHKLKVSTLFKLDSQKHFYHRHKPLLSVCIQTASSISHTQGSLHQKMHLYYSFSRVSVFMHDITQLFAAHLSCVMIIKNVGGMTFFKAHQAWCLF